MKRSVVLALVLLMLTLTACGGEKRIVHCDRCQAEIEVDADSNITEDWILFCNDCAKEVEPGVVDAVNGK